MAIGRFSLDCGSKDDIQRTLTSSDVAVVDDHDHWDAMSRISMSRVPRSTERNTSE